MKSKYLNKKLEKILSWAVALNEATIANDTSLPKEMVYAINSLNDAVWEAKGKVELPELPDGFKELMDGFRKEREEFVKNLGFMRRN